MRTADALPVCPRRPYRPGAARAVLVPAVLLLMAISADAYGAPSAVKGHVVLSGDDLQNGVSLSGEWEFYPNRLVDPRTFMNPGGDALRGVMMQVPGSWAGQHAGAPVTGSGTYRLVVDLPSAGDRIVGLHFQSVATAFRAFCNGQLIAENGRVSTDISAVQGTYAPVSAFVSASDRLEIVLQVSNAEDTRAGLMVAPFLARQSVVTSLASRETLIDAIICAAILIMGLYHVMLAILHPAEKASLYFGILSIDLALRTALTGARLLHQFAGGLGFHGLIAAEFMTVYIGGLAVYLYFSQLYPREELRFARVPVIAVNGGYCVFVAFVPVQTIAMAHFYYELFLMCEGVLIVAWIIRALAARREGAFIMLSGFLVMLAGAAYDIILDQTHSSRLFVTPYAMVVFIFLQSALIAYRYAGAYASAREQSAKAEALASSFERFVPREFLSLLGKESVENVSLGECIELELTALFADIRSFTSLSENMTPVENFRFLNSYLKRVSPVVHRNRGFIDKYLGDGIMALFPRSPMDAVRAGLEIMEVLRVFNGHRANSGYRPIELGVGINTGRMMLGTIGERSRMQGTVISDTVNLASRLEGATRSFQSGIIMSENVLSAAADIHEVPHRYLGRIKVKGKSRAVRVYEVIDAPDTSRIATRRSFEQAVRAYETRDLKAAAEGFSAVLESDPFDGAARFYMTRMKAPAGTPAIGAR